MNSTTALYALNVLQNELGQVALTKDKLKGLLNELNPRNSDREDRTSKDKPLFAKHADYLTLDLGVENRESMEHRVTKLCFINDLRRCICSLANKNGIFRPENIGLINDIIDGQTEGVFLGKEGYEVNAYLLHKMVESTVSSSIFSKYDIRVVRVTSRGAYRLNDTPLIFSYGFYIQLVDRETGELVVLGKSNAARVPLKSAEWGYPKGHKDANWVIKKDDEANTRLLESSTMLITMKWKKLGPKEHAENLMSTWSKIDSGYWTLGDLNEDKTTTAYLVSDIPELDRSGDVVDGIHQVTGGLFCFQRALEKECEELNRVGESAMVEAIKLKNAGFRVNRQYLPDENGEVFAMASGYD